MSQIDKLLKKYKLIEGERFFDELFRKNEYEAAKFKSHIVLDVGACAGEFAAYIYDYADIIYAIEPHEDHYNELEFNIKEFGLDKIRPFKLALYKTDGEAKLTNESRGSHRLDDSGVEVVKTQTLKTFLDENGIDKVDILKIDIENGEKDIFNEDFKEISDRIDFIIGEHLDVVRPLLESCGFNYHREKDNLVFKK